MVIAEYNTWEIIPTLKADRRSRDLPPLAFYILRVKHAYENAKEENNRQKSK